MGAKQLFGAQEMAKHHMFGRSVVVVSIRCRRAAGGNTLGAEAKQFALLCEHNVEAMRRRALRWGRTLPTLLVLRSLHVVGAAHGHSHAGRTPLRCRCSHPTCGMAFSK